jgi:hypothetical protein
MGVWAATLACILQTRKCPIVIFFLYFFKTFYEPFLTKFLLHITDLKIYLSKNMSYFLAHWSNCVIGLGSMTRAKYDQAIVSLNWAVRKVRPLA